MQTFLSSARFRAAALGLAALAILSAAPPAGAQEAPVPQIAVAGRGEAAAIPDMATLRLGVEVDADSASEAMNAASGVVTRLLDRLSEFGVDPRDVQTSSLSLDPLRSGRDGGGAPRIDGYVVRNQVTVRVRDLDRLGEILAVALEDGANALGGLEFGVAEPAPLIDAARREAVQEARAKAELFAEAAGTRLGRLLRIEEAGGGMPRPMPMAEMRSLADVPVAAGETAFSAQVTLIFELLE